MMGITHHHPLHTLESLHCTHTVCTSKDISYKLIVELTKDLKTKSLCLIFINNPNVNMKFQQEFSTKFKDENYHKIIDTGIFPFVYLKRRLELVQNEA